jgi:hypothetical protein
LIWSSNNNFAFQNMEILAILIIAKCYQYRVLVKVAPSLLCMV